MKKDIAINTLWLFCFGMYLEMILLVMCDLPLNGFTIAGEVLTHLFAALFMTFIITMLPSEKANRWIGFAILEIATIYYIAAYFTDNSFKVFMNLKTMLTGAEDVMTDFSDRIAVLLTKGLPVILLFHVPALVYLFLGKKLLCFKKAGIKLNLISIAAGVVMLVLSNVLFMNAPVVSASYKENYEYDSAVRNLGLISATELDVRYALFGNHYADDFEVNAGDGEVIDYGALEEDDITETETPEEGNESAEVPSGESGINETESTAENGEENAEDDIAAEPEKPKEKTYGYNVMDIDFDKLISEESNDSLVNVYNYIAAGTPSHKNEYTGLFRNKNLIIITAEAFSAEVIDEERTPALYRLANKGIQFTDYYQPAWGGSTSTGEFSVLTGIIPTDGVSSVKETKDKNLYFTMGNQLMRKDYFSRAYHNNTYTYYGRNETHENFGYEKFIGLGNGMEEGVQKVWPESDLEMIQFTLDEYIDRQPFSIYYMTVSGHCLYNFGGNKMAAKNKDMYADMDAPTQIKAYYACNQELENAMAYLLDTLEAKGIADDTVIVLSADHYPYGLSQSTAWQNDEDYLAMLYGYSANTNPKRDHSRLILWCGCLEDEEPIVVDTPTYSLDILPTLSNLFGVKFDSRVMIGRDVLSDAEPLVIWNDYDWMTDLGYYDAGKGKFTPNEGVTVDDDYITEHKNTVKAKMAISKAALKYQLYGNIISAWNRATKLVN